MTVRFEITTFGKHAEDIRKIRQAVFVVEQGIDPRLEWDELDNSASFALAIHHTEGVIGTARFFPDGKIGRMAVLKEWRGQGIGSAILEEIINYTRQSGLTSLHLSAQQSAIPFYTKNGFSPVGDSYHEAGILHQEMTLWINS